MADQRFFGWRPSLPDARDYRYQVPPAHRVALPAAVDNDTPSPGAPFDPVFDQGNLGSCGPNALMGDTAYRGIADKAGRLGGSRLFVYYFTRLIMGTTGYDSGVDNRSMLKALAQYGYCDETLWPYDVRKFTNKPSSQAIDQAAARAGQIEYQAVNQALTDMKSVLAGGDCFVFGFTCYNSMMTAAVDASGDIPMPSKRDGVAGGHDVLFVGYDDATQRFKLRNSWGTGWGKNGYGTIPYDYATSPQLASDFWRVTKLSPIVPPAPPGPTPDPTPTPTAVLLTISGAMAAGNYMVLPASTQEQLWAAGLTPMQMLQIFAAVAAFMADKPITAPKLLALVMTIAAILGTPVSDAQVQEICREVLKIMNHREINS